MNIFGKTFFHEYCVIEISNFSIKPKVREMGGNFQLQNRLNFLSRVWPSDQCPKRRMLWSQLEPLYDFQNLLSFFETVIFLENRKNSVSSKISTFGVFFLSGAPSCSNAHYELIVNLVKNITFL